MKSFKMRIISFILCVAFTLTVWPLATFAESVDIDGILPILENVLDMIRTGSDTQAQDTPNVDENGFPTCDCGTTTEVHLETCSLAHCAECGYVENHAATCSLYVDPNICVECNSNPCICAENNSAEDSTEDEENLNAPAHDCDSEASVALENHNDSCSRKQYCKDVADGNSAAELYSIWNDLPEDVQDFILIYLSWGQNDKLAELKDLLENGSEPDEPEIEFVEYEPIKFDEFSVSASAEKGVFPEGVAMNASLVDDISDSADEILAAIESIEDFDDFEIVDILAANITFGNDEQPDGAVYMSFQFDSSIADTANTAVVLHEGSDGWEVVSYSYLDSLAETQTVNFTAYSFSSYVVALVEQKYLAKLMSKVIEADSTLKEKYSIVTFPVTLNDFDAEAFNKQYDSGQDDSLIFTTGNKSGAGMNLGSVAATQGIVEDKLSDNGYPITTGKDDRGEILFGIDGNIAGKTVYSNVDFEFIYNKESGYYTYNSGANHAQYNNDNRKVELYADTLAPYNYLYSVYADNGKYGMLDDKFSTGDGISKLEKFDSQGYRQIKVNKQPTEDEIIFYVYKDGGIASSLSQLYNADDGYYVGNFYLRMYSNHEGKIIAKVTYDNGPDQYCELDLQKDTWADYVFGDFYKDRKITGIYFYLPNAKANDYIQYRIAGFLQTKNDTGVNLAGFYPFNSDITESYGGFDEFTIEKWQNRVDEGINEGFLPSRTIYHSVLKNGENKLSDEYAYFAMSMEVDFYIPADGTVNKNPIEFEFTGDDDMWVFVDDELALDIGGAHTAVSGSINFTTGDTYVSKARVLTGTNYKEDKYDKLSLTQYAPGEYHTLKIFYMERAGTNSNCLIKFNLPVVPTGSVEVSKNVSQKDENGDIIKTDNSLIEQVFEFQIFVTDSDGNQHALPQKYHVVEGDKSKEETLADDGKFSLKHGQKAVFNINENYGVTVTETQADISGYELVSTEVNGKEALSATLTTVAGATQQFKFENIYKRSLVDLIIEKVVDEDEIALDPGQTFLFHVIGDDFSMDVVIAGIGSVTIKDLPVGNYTVAEDTSWSWRYEVSEVKVNNQSQDYQNSVEVTLSDITTTVTFKNTRTEDKWLDGNAFAENDFSKEGTFSEGGKIDDE